MSKILLSICIPTYNRPEHLSKIIEQLISFQNEEFEIVISDDNPLSDKNKEIVLQFKDSRIKYFRNKKNLGFDANQLITFKRAKGEYVFLLMDDDEVELKTLPWILKTIKNNKNLTVLRGTLGDKRPGSIKPYYQFEDKYYKKNSRSLTKFFLFKPHGSGIILKRAALDLNKAKKYIGCLIIQQILEAQAMLKGDSLHTSMIFAYVGEIDYESDQPLFKGRGYWHPVGALNIVKYKIQMIYDFFGTKNNQKIRDFLLERQIRIIYSRLYKAIFQESFNILNSLRALVEGLSIVISMKKISKSPKFWINFIYELFSMFKLQNLTKKNIKPTQNFINLICKGLINKRRFFLLASDQREFILQGIVKNLNKLGAKVYAISNFSNNYIVNEGDIIIAIFGPGTTEYVQNLLNNFKNNVKPFAIIKVISTFEKIIRSGADITIVLQGGTKRYRVKEIDDQIIQTPDNVAFDKAVLMYFTSLFEKFEIRKLEEIKKTD